MLKKFTPGGLILSSLCLLSFLLSIRVIQFGFSGSYHPDFGDWLFLDYIVQVAVLIVALSLRGFHGFFSDSDLALIINLAFINLLIYLLACIGFGLFDIYFPKMFEMLADLLNSVFLVCIVFWYRRIMG